MGIILMYNKNILKKDWVINMKKILKFIAELFIFILFFPVIIIMKLFIKPEKLNNESEETI